MANSDGDNEGAITFSAPSDNGYSSSAEATTENHSNSNHTPVRHQSETFSDNEYDFSDAHIMHSTDAVYEETTDTESMNDSIVCNGGKNVTGDGRKRKNGNIASRFEMAPLLDNETQQIV